MNNIKTIEENTIRCSRCGEDKEFSEFSKNYHYRCRKCVSEINKERRKRLIKIKVCNVCGVNPTQLNNNRCEECIKKVKLRRKSRKDVKRCVVCNSNKAERGKVTCDECLSKEKQRKRLLRENHICTVCRKNRVSISRTCPECQKRGREKDKELKQSTMKAYGSKCACCGETNLEFLCIDHINGGGNKHRAQFKGSGGGRDIYRWLIKNNYPEGFQVLCFNCNHSKGLFGKCAHEEDFSILRESRLSDYIGQSTQKCIDCGLEKNITDFYKHGYKGKYNIHCKDCHNNRARLQRRKLKLECLRNYGGAVCQCCGETIVEFLTIDHINGGGNKHRKEIGGNGKLYSWLKKNGFPNGYRVLCMNCNFSIGHFGSCPHSS